jgi:hypothetical protein
MPVLLDEGLRGYWENPAFVIGIATLVLGALLLLIIARNGRASNDQTAGGGVLGSLTFERSSWLVAGAAGAALLVAGIVYNPAFAVGGGFIVLVATIRLLTD